MSKYLERTAHELQNRLKKQGEEFDAGNYDYILDVLREVEDTALQRARSAIHGSSLDFLPRNNAARIVRQQMHYPDRSEFKLLDDRD